MKILINFNENDKFLPINVFKFPLGNCGGITDFEKTIYIPCKEGFIDYSSIENKNLIFIEEQRGPEYWALKPNFQKSGLIGPMSGGNLAYSSDSRCKRIYHIHDRFEGNIEIEKKIHQYIIITSQGNTEAPNGEDCENIQVLGIVDAISKENAAEKFLEENEYILDLEFNPEDFIIYQILKD